MRYALLPLLLFAGCTPPTATQVNTIQADADAAVVVSYAALATEFKPQPQPEPTPAPSPQPSPDTGKPDAEASVIRPKMGTSYADAHAGYKAGRPLLVIVGADWCSPCRALKTAMPGHIDAGVLDGRELVILDWEKDRKQAQPMVGSQPTLPTLLYFWVENGQSYRRKHVGSIGREGLRELVAPPQAGPPTKIGP